MQLNPIYQDQKPATAKDTYGFIKTDDIMSQFESKGWTPVSTQVNRTAKPEKQGFQKHLIKFEHELYQNVPGLPDHHSGKIQLCLLNSHDGTTSFRLFLGFLLIACLNGILAGTALSDIRLVHSKNVVNRLPLAIDTISNSIPQLLSQLEMLANKQFTPAAAEQFVKNAVHARLKNVQRVQSIDYNSALKTLRAADRNSDAFTLFNVVQEKIIRGGVRYTYDRKYTDQFNREILKRTTTTTRRLSSVTSQVQLNQYIYDQALELAA